MEDNTLDNLVVSVTGLGYVGLPIALVFSKKTKVIGFDIDESRIELLKKGIDPTGEIPASEFEGCDIEFTSDAKGLASANFHIVAVPTPINPSQQPDLAPLLSASHILGSIIKKGDYVVYESTVYPCLLYTSPSPRDLSTSRMPSSA